MKLKTHKTTAKRIRATGSGKLVITKTSAQHLRHNKSKRQKAAAKGYQDLHLGMKRRLKKLLPYI